MKCNNLTEKEIDRKALSFTTNIFEDQEFYLKVRSTITESLLKIYKTISRFQAEFYKSKPGGQEW